MKRLLPLVLAMTWASGAFAGPQVRLDTSAGPVTIELDDQKAPLSTENFLSYVDSGYYDGTAFHRVIDGFMVQGGGFTADLQRKPTEPPIANEADNGLTNDRGTLAMARTSDPNSATSQFFINLVDNAFLNHPGQDGYGYAVFGRVIEGMDVVDAIAKSATGPAGPFRSDVPNPIVVIESATRLNP